MSQVLIIDDDELFCELLTIKAEELGTHPASAHTMEEGWKLASTQPFDLVFLDVRLPDGNGLDLLPKLKQTSSAPEVIIITGLGDADGAELAIKSGAWDYVEKGSFTLKEMSLILSRALQYREEKSSAKVPLALKREGIIGTSQPMQACYDLLAQASASDANVLITGETGTGKELFARAVHHNSKRASGRFVVVDCAAIPISLVESLLFGHRRGSFTGADRSRKGLIEQAHGGSLFLDEVGELPMSMQKAFLRVLQERRFRPLGSTQEIESDFRLIAATNRDLEEMSAQKQFRQDLLFRLRSLVMELPPLRDRVDDLHDLVLFHVDKICSRFGIRHKGFDPEFMEALKHYHWPGNVRELVNTLEQVITASQTSPTLFPHHLPEKMRIDLARASLTKDAPAESPEPKPDSDYWGAPSSPDITPSETAKAEPRPRLSEPEVRWTEPETREPQPSGDQLPPWKDYLKAAASKSEKLYLNRLLQITNGDVNSACKIAGLSRSTLYHHLKKHGISTRDH